MTAAITFTLPSFLIFHHCCCIPPSLADWQLTERERGGRKTATWVLGCACRGVSTLDHDLPLWCPGGQGAAGEAVQLPPSFTWPQVSSVLSWGISFVTHTHTHICGKSITHTQNAAAARVRAATCSGRSGDSGELARSGDLRRQAGMTGSYSNCRPATANNTVSLLLLLAPQSDGKSIQSSSHAGVDDWRVTGQKHEDLSFLLRLHFLPNM